MEDILLRKIDEISDQMIDGIKRIVRINSVQGEAEEDAPFGKGVDAALQETLKLAQELGFETEEIDHYMGIAKYETDVNKELPYLGIIGHLDVVPPGKGWNHPPFSAYEENGRIYSRGILDNKGPILSNLYALYAIKELGISLKYPVHILFGTNEETGFKDLEYFLERKKPPFLGWTPDCKYPAVYAERGRIVVQITSDDQQAFNFFVNEYLLSSNEHANKMGLDISDEEFGVMQLRNIRLTESEQRYAVSFSFSYPAVITADEIIQKIKTCLNDKLEMQVVTNWNPVRFDKEGYLCTTLKETYEKVTGMDGTPVTTTGGTYAKLMPNIVPFGPSFPGQKGIGHNPDEWMDRSDLILNAKIYALSILRLAQEEK